ncbi:MAG: TniQ family protein [Candidatus Heimdallarchaeota archaeon]
MITLSGQSRRENVIARFQTAKTTLQTKNHSWEKMLILPKEGESFLSWLLRQAWAFDITLRRFIQTEKEYWAAHENISLLFPRKWKWLENIDLVPISLNFEDKLRQRGLLVDVEKLRVDISKWIDLSKKSKIDKYQLRNYYHYRLRYCPKCWEDEKNRYFRKIWRLPFVFVCLDHGVELKESCDSCGKILYDESILQDFQPRYLLECPHCNQSLVGVTLEEEPEITLLQKKIIRILQSNLPWASPKGYLVLWKSYQMAIGQHELNNVESHLRLMENILQHQISDSTKTVCPTCGKANFGSKSRYREHIWACDQKHVCPTCSRTHFGSKSTYDKHVWICGKERICPICGRTNFESKTTYDDHVWACGKERKCPHCEQTNYESKGGYNNHVWACERERKCPHCGLAGFETKGSYDSHVWACGKKRCCSSCERTDFENKVAYDKHIWMCGKERICSCCGRTDFNTRAAYDDHVWACGRNLVCPHCGIGGFKSRSGYRGHVWACEHKPTCPVCGKMGFKSRTGYNRHVQRCKGNN